MTKHRDVNKCRRLSLAQLFLLCALMTVVVHSFVADSSLLNYYGLVVFFCVWVGVFLPPYACR